MLIPIGTDVVHHRKPTVTYFLIATNVLIFAIQWATVRNGGLQSNSEFVRSISSMLSAGELSGVHFHIYSLITYQFIHASWWHVLGNMIFLLPFGKAVEDRMGHIGFVCFYLGTGMLCGGLHALSSPIPVIGASGSVCAVTAAFLVLAPKTNINVIFIFFLIAVIKIPSILFVIFFVLFDTLGLLSSAVGVSDSQTAWVVHLGGYITGFCIAWLLLASHIIKSSEYDFPTMIKQFKRRSQFKHVVQKAHSEIFETQEINDPVALEKAEITQLFVTGKVDEASSKYFEAVLSDPQFCLDRKTQLAMANHLMSNNDIKNACLAFEQFLKGHAEAEEVGEVALLLSAKYIRVLHQSEEARKLLKNYKKKFSEQHQSLVQALQQELGT